MEKLLLVFIGGGAGAAARYGVGVGVGRLGWSGWPYATFLVNVLGGLLMGLLMGVLADRALSENWRLALGVGLLGGFTTFSAFSLETAAMIERRELLGAGTYAVASVVLSVAAVFVGLWLTRRGMA